MDTKQSGTWGDMTHHAITPNEQICLGETVVMIFWENPWLRSGYRDTLIPEWKDSVVFKLAPSNGFAVSAKLFCNLLLGSLSLGVCMLLVPFLVWT